MLTKFNANIQIMSELTNKTAVKVPFRGFRGLIPLLGRG
jgi:hypothetical protein